jgi:quercetin dioxygenase-like cupin family protein
MAYTLRLFTDTLAPNAKPAPLPAANRVLYVVKGAALVEAGGSLARLTAGSSGFSAGAISIGSDGEGAEVLRWDLVRDSEPNDGMLANATTKRTLTAPVTLGGDVIMRLDTVALGVGGKAPLHYHQGPGIRCLLEGGFTVQTQGNTHSYKPGEAWFETGPDHVLAWAPDDKPAKFARVMILPRALEGKQSTRYVDTDPVIATAGRRWEIHFDRAIDP